MTRTNIAVIAAVATLLAAGAGGPVRAAAERPSLAGRWTLNRALSQLPRELGFGMDTLARPGVATTGDDTGGRDTGGGVGMTSLSSVRESEDDAQRTRQLVAEVRSPARHLVIEQTDSAVTITDGLGRSRTLHPNGREEYVSLGQVPVATTSRWDGDGLEVRFKVAPNRELRYTFTRTLDPEQLVVQVQFVERGGRGTVTRVYEPTRAGEPAGPEKVDPDPAPVPPPPAAAMKSTEAPEAGAAPGAAPASAPPAGAAAAGAPPAGAAPPASAPAGAPPSRPAGTWSPGEPVPRPAGAAPPGTFPAGAPPSEQGQPAVPRAGGGTQAPIVGHGVDGELKGISKLGVVVEDLSGQAAACGLLPTPLESAVVKSLTDAGFTVARNSDEDTYVYVYVMTASVMPGLCVSRFDVYLYTNTTATLSYQTTPAVVQVTLLHKAGISGGPPGGHGTAVVKTVKEYVDEFATRIRNVNK